MEDPRSFIKELILENFMSYEYARVPFKPGVNLIIGPNGAGKSTILIAISVALGQTYTERSRALRDLIRRGERIARVTIVLDNRPINGKRPIKGYRTDEVYLTRYLKLDGTYWYEINNRAVTKTEVLRILSRLGINPDNMLIIMHQGMIERFSVLNPQEKLRMLEEALGIQEYRERIIKAREELSHILSEEEAIKQMLERAENTLKHWEEKYKEYLKKRELEKKREKLRSEYMWAKCIRKEKIKEKIEKALEQLQEERRREKLKVEGRINKASTIKQKMDAFLDQMDLIVKKILEGSADKNKLVKMFFKNKRSYLDLFEEYVAIREEIAVSKFYVKILGERISRLKSEYNRVLKELKKLESEALNVSPRVETDRDPNEILDDIRVINAQLATLRDVSEEVEKMYMKYSDIYRDLKNKAEKVAENRKRALEELKTREEIWRRRIMAIIRDVEEVYKEILASMNAIGSIRLIDQEDVEKAGLEILVGFRGGSPAVLDAYTQSGGERTVAIVSFLLALQQYIKSPIRGIDEFDVHCDPINREILMRYILKLTSESGSQYIVITPGQVTGLKGAPHVITVQNIAGRSIVRLTGK